MGLKDIIDMLTSLRDEWSEERPNEIINSYSPNSISKWRYPSWSMVILSQFYFIEEEGYMNEDIKKVYTEYQKFLNTRGWTSCCDNRLTNEEDIRKGNDLIDYALEILQKPIYLEKAS